MCPIVLNSKITYINKKRETCVTVQIPLTLFQSFITFSPKPHKELKLGTAYSQVGTRHSLRNGLKNGQVCVLDKVFKYSVKHYNVSP